MPRDLRLVSARWPDGWADGEDCGDTYDNHRCAGSPREAARPVTARILLSICTLGAPVPHLLHLDASSSGDLSVSRQVTAAFSQSWADHGENHTITYRDLNADPLPHLADSELHYAPHLRSPGANPPEDLAHLQSTLIAELAAADVLLLGAPLYNYTLPATLKTWVDHIHVLGVTAPFGNDIQPVKGRPCVVVTSQGAFYGEGSPNPTGDHLVPVLDLVLGTALGMSLTVLTASWTLAERLAPLAGMLTESQEQRSAAIRDARALAIELG